MPTANPSMLATAERLKKVGNDLYIRREYEAAHHAYSQAIEKDPENPILYANRAATCLARKEYLDAAFDAQHAVTLDPTYTKAWGRLGAATEALEIWPRCVAAWEGALESLPSDEALLTGSQREMKAQFERGMKKARAALEAPRVAKFSTMSLDSPGVDKQEDLPWNKANSLLSQKIAENRPTTVFALANAYEDWLAGLEAMKSLKVHEVQEEETYTGIPTALTHLCDAIMRDDRVFHVTGLSKWEEKVRKQCMFENGVLQGWASEDLPETIRPKILHTLKTKGWEVVRPAFGITIRVWVFQAFNRCKFQPGLLLSHQMYASAIKLLEWGRNQWPEVPTKVRGVVLERSFIRTIKKLQMTNMHKIIAREGANGEVSLEELRDLAKDIIEDVDSDPAPRELIQSYGDYFSFWVYPKADALSFLGFYYYCRGGLPSRKDDANGKQADFKKAASYYRDAAMLYPDDDLGHAYSLRMSFEALCLAKSPLRETLPLCKRIREVVPKVMEVWRLSNDSLDRYVPLFGEFELQNLADIIEGRSTWDTVAQPWFLSNNPRSKAEHHLHQ